MRIKDIYDEFNRLIMSDGILNSEVVAINYYDFIYKNNSSLKKIRTARNRTKLVKLYINRKFVGYILLDKLNRNLHIEGDIKTLGTNY